MRESSRNGQSAVRKVLYDSRRYGIALIRPPMLFVDTSRSSLQLGTKMGTVPCPIFLARAVEVELMNPSHFYRLLASTRRLLGAGNSRARRIRLVKRDSAIL